MSHFGRTFHLWEKYSGVLSWWSLLVKPLAIKKVNPAPVFISLNNKRILNLIDSPDFPSFLSTPGLWNTLLSSLAGCTAQNFLEHKSAHKIAMSSYHNPSLGPKTLAAKWTLIKQTGNGNTQRSRVLPSLLPKFIKFLNNSFRKFYTALIKPGSFIWNYIILFIGWYSSKMFIPLIFMGTEDQTGSTHLNDSNPFFSIFFSKRSLRLPWEQVLSASPV